MEVNLNEGGNNTFGDSLDLGDKRNVVPSKIHVISTYWLPMGEKITL